MQEIGFDVNR